MEDALPELSYIIDEDNFRTIQDSLSDATEMAMLTVDLRGNPITAHSNCSKFCKMVRSDLDLFDQCRKCDARGGLEAARLQRPYIYTCHMGLIDFAVPLIIDDHYLGAIMAGQVRLPDHSPTGDLETVVLTDRKKIPLTLLRELDSLREELPVLSIDKVQIVARMMFHISNYIVAESLARLELMGTPYSRMEGASRGIALNKPGNLIGAPPILWPALEYIQDHYSEDLSLAALAKLCRVSPNYFSRIFNRSLGENLAQYVQRVRIFHAKRRLAETEDPVTSISFDMGFEDSGYFNKVFKKLVGMTPSEYRRDTIGTGKKQHWLS
jgi:ligand-binding sensor protein/AraC-like DNA-binding protein